MPQSTMERSHKRHNSYSLLFHSPCLVIQIKYTEDFQCYMRPCMQERDNPQLWRLWIRGGNMSWCEIHGEASERGNSTILTVKFRPNKKKYNKRNLKDYLFYEGMEGMTEIVTCWNDTVYELLGCIIKHFLA